jgi:hypothetical protein
MYLQCLIFSHFLLSQANKDLFLIEEDTVGLEREEFRKYLEQNGVMESLIKVMTDLFLEENKPEDPVEYPFCIEILSRVAFLRRMP